MTVLIDSWAWIEYFKSSEAGKRAKGFIEGGSIIISAINVAEVFRHMLILSKKDAEDALSFMLKISFVVPVSVKLAKDAALIKHEKKWGLGDSIVLATALQHGAKVVTGDSDFKNEPSVIFLG